MQQKKKDGGRGSNSQYLEDKAEWEKEELLLVDEVQHHSPIVQIMKGHIDSRMLFLYTTHGNTCSKIMCCLIKDIDSYF